MGKKFKVVTQYINTTDQVVLNKDVRQKKRVSNTKSEGSSDKRKSKKTYNRLRKQSQKSACSQILEEPLINNNSSDETINPHCIKVLGPNPTPDLISQPSIEKNVCVTMDTTNQKPTKIINQSFVENIVQPQNLNQGEQKIDENSVVDVIFNTLFGHKMSKKDGQSECEEETWHDWDEVGDENEIDENWIKSSIRTLIVNSREINLNFDSFVDTNTILNRYFTVDFLYSMITALRYEDPRIPTPRLMLLKAIFETISRFRNDISRVLTQVSHDQLQNLRRLDEKVFFSEVDPEKMKNNEFLWDFDRENSKSKKEYIYEIIELQIYLIECLTTLECGDEDDEIGTSTNSNPTPLSLNHDTKIFTSFRDPTDSDGTQSSTQSVNDINRDVCVWSFDPSKRRFEPDPSIFRYRWHAMIVKDAIKTLGNLFRSHISNIQNNSEPEQQDYQSELGLLIKCCTALICIYPTTSVSLIRHLIRCWPIGNSNKEMSFLKIIGAIIHCSPHPQLLYPNTSIHRSVIERLANCISSAHIKISQSAIEICLDPTIVSKYLIPFPEHLKIIKKALIQNKHHWNSTIREMSDSSFDLFLDLT